jgi:hypothetical protein
MIAMLLLLTSCGGDAKTDGTQSATGSDSTAIDPGTFDFDTLKGIYTGDFGQSNLKLVISYAGEMHATGYNIVKGVQRNISGKVTLKPETVEMELSEPGDDKNDGVFHISVDRKTLLMTGTWKPNNPKLKEKSFVLDRIVMPKNDEELTAANFSYTFNHIGDSLGDLFFNDDGSCRYEYYIGPDGAPTSVSLNDRVDAPRSGVEQLHDFTGSWTYRNNRVIIEWEENAIFPSRKSVFDISIERSEEGYFNGATISGEGRELSCYMW